MGKVLEGKNTLSQEITKLKSIHSAYGNFLLKGSRLLGMDSKRNPNNQTNKPSKTQTTIDMNMIVLTYLEQILVSES